MLESGLQNTRPPLLVGERAVWLGSGSGLPQGGTVRWMGKLQGMGPGWTVGLELDRSLPYGGIDGSWCGRQLFQCRTKHGLLVPANVVVKEDALLRTFGISPVILNKPPPTPPTQIEARAPSQQSISEISITSTSSQKGVTKPKRTKHPSGDSSTRSSQSSVSKKKPAPQPPGRKSETPKPPLPTPQQQQQSSEIKQTENQVTSPQVKVSSLQPNLNPPVEENKLENRPDSLPLETITSVPLPTEVKPEVVEVPIVEVPPAKPASQKKTSKAPLPPAKAKAGYFHTAPARPNRHLRGVKQPAPAVPSSPAGSEESQQPAEQASSSLPHIANKETAEYAWSGAVEQRTTTPPRVPLRRHNSYNGPRQTTSESSSTSSLTPNVAPATVDELIYQWFDASENPPTAPPRHGKFKPPSPSMNNKSITPSLSPTSSTSSFEDAIAAADAIYSERFNKRFAVDSASSISSNSSSNNNNNNNNRKSGSGFLSFLRWLRKGGSDTSDEKVNELSRAGSTNSLGTVVSAASSFAYVSPTAYNLTDNRASLHYSPSPSDTDTYKYRIKQRDHARKLDKNLTLKRKYKLKQFACSQETVFSDTLKPSVTNAVIPKPSTGSGRRRNKRPAPPIPTKKSEHYSDCSLPVSLEQRARLMMEMLDDSDKPGAVKLHRRTASESSKDKRAGAYCHVRGKRRAPQPPSNIIRQNGALSSKFKNPFPSFGRKKRQAPSPPPGDISETSTKLSNEEKQRLISNINKLKLHAAGRNDRITTNGDTNLQGPAVITAPPIVLNALHLQEGDPPPVTPEPVTNKAAMSPKPWYKRNSNKVAKVDKRVKKDEEEMPEVGYARVLPSPDENKRKSVQLSMLASISELDREAAEIVQNQHKRAAELIAARNNSFYLPPIQDGDSPSSSATITPSATTPESPTPPATPDSPTPKVHTKGLISMFNAITNVSKVTVNSSTAAIAGFFNGDARKNRISQTFAIVEEDEEEKENSTTTNVTITEVQSTSSQITSVSKAITINNNEDIKMDIKKANKDNSEIKIISNSSQIENEIKNKVLPDKGNVRENKQEIVKESVKENKKKEKAKNKTKENVKETANQPADDVVKFNGNSVKRSLYPRLSAFEPKEQEKPKDPPLPLSISGISDDSSHRRQKRIVWSCPRCTLENPRWRLTCDVCDMWRPSSMHEETVLPFEGTIHAEPKHLETNNNNNEEKDKTDNDIDELKPPEPIGAIDWEAELKRYFDPKKETKIEEKKPDPSKKQSPLLNPKVEEAIKILEGKQPVIESPKLRTRVSSNIIKIPESPKLQPAVKKEPEYAALVKKTPAPKLVETTSVVNKTAQPYKPPVATATSGGVIKNEERKINAVKPTPPKTPVKTAEAVKVPETFIGGRTNKTETETPKVTPVEGKTVAGTSTTGDIVAKILSKEDVDEVRKARLAFFNKPQDPNLVTSENIPPASPKITRATQSPVVPSSPRLGRAKTTEIATDTQELVKITMAAISTPAVTAADREERMRLREKLKEMKNSLPKHDNRPEIKEIKKEPILHITEVSQGAIKKVNTATATTVNKPEVGYENVKSRRVLNKPVKVSTSVQTSGVVARKPKVEEPVDTEAPAGNIKGGKLYTSLSKSPSFRGTGTFHLIGAKDFATIEATKSQKSASSTTTAAPLQHVYANVPSPGLVQEGPSEQTKNVPVPVKVETPPPPAPVVVTEKPEPKPVTPSPAAPNQVVVKVETKALVIDDEEDEEMMFDEDQSASGVLDDALNLSGDASDIEKLAGMLTRPKGLAEFKADLAAAPPQQQSNTLAVNRLLRRLEAAIANGQHRIAAGLARDLARLKISCSVVRQRKAQIEPELFSVDMYVEDKVQHQGPIPLSVSASMTVGELKLKVQQEFEIPSNVQRWILGKQLASDDTKTLQQHSVAAPGCTVFLYLVAPPERTESSSPATEPSAPAPTPPPAEENTRIVPTVEPPRGPGWYYNFEEDRYSYCESSDEDDVSEPEPEPPKPAVSQSTAAHAPPPATAPVIKLAEPEASESSSEEDEEEEEPGAAGGLLPTAPPATLSTEKKTGTLMLGWKCPVCTLINSPTRPGCAACTTERPLTYRVPTAYEASEQEAQRLKREEELEKAAEAEEAGLNAVATVDNYQALLALDNTDLVSNVEMFECSICMAACVPGDGAVLRECLHAFCRACLAHTAQFSEEVEVRCPFRNKEYACDATLQEREVRALVPPDIYERMQAKSVAQAENKIQNAFHCKTPDCRGWCIFEDNVNDFACPVCGHHNCLTCQAIHDGINCRQYQERVTQASETDAEARRTKEMLEEMVERGEALCCPTCQVVLMKKWGCDWLRCSMCKTEICWVTRGPRWGPGGKGDTSGGCKCGINGIKCHPKCNYCH